MVRVIRFTLTLAMIVVLSGCPNDLVATIQEDVAAGTLPSIEILDVASQTVVQDGDSLRLPSVSVGGHTERLYSVSNSGAGTLRIASIACSGSSDWFSVGVPSTAELEAGASATFRLEISPDSTNTATAVITVESDARNGARIAFEIEVSGTMLGGSLSINSDDEFTNAAAVTLELTPDHPSSVESMKIANTPDLDLAVAERFSSSVPWTLSDGDGLKNVYLQFLDSDGNETETPILDSIVLDTQVPTAPYAPLLADGDDTGVSDSDGITRKTAVMLVGTREAFALVEVVSSRDGLLGTVARGSSVSWELPVTLTPGSHSITFSQTDRAGNQSDSSAALPVEVDTTAPGAPGRPDLASSHDTGSSDSDDVTSRLADLEIGGLNGVSGTTIELRSSRDGVLATVAVSGAAWSTTVAALSQGEHTITAISTDLAGNQSADSPTLELTIDAAAPGRPLFISPQRARNTSLDLTPAFSWALAPDQGAEAFQLQIDDDPSFDSPYYDSNFANGQTSYEPAVAMPVSSSPPIGRRYYYRVRARDLAGNVGAWSPSPAVRYVNVGRAEQDFNGDGYSDVAVIGSGHFDSPLWSPSGTAHIFFGGNPMNDSVDVVMSDSFAGYAPAVAFCDLNGDGFSDLVIGSSLNRKVMVLYGSASPAASESADLVINTSTSSFGAGVACGDLNGDGYDDLAVTADTSGTNTFVYYGGSLDAIADVSFAGTHSTGYGRGLAVEDINGDGFGDLLVGISDAPGGGAVRAHLGAASGPASIAAQSYTVQDGSLTVGDFGTSVAAIGDGNGDGYGDFVVGAPGTVYGAGYQGGMIFVFGGGASLPGAVVDQEFGLDGSRFGESVARAGDMDGDGRFDLIVGAPNRTSGLTAQGGVEVLFSNGSLSIAPAEVRKSGATAGETLGKGVSGAGDVNRDGLSDIILGAPGYNDSYPGPAGRAFVYLGALNRGDIFGPSMWYPSTEPKELESPAQGEHFGIRAD